VWSPPTGSWARSCDASIRRLLEEPLRESRLGPPSEPGFDPSSLHKGGLTR